MNAKDVNNAEIIRLVTKHLEIISYLLGEQLKITLLARDPKWLNGEGDVYISNDDTGEVANAILKRLNEEASQ